MAGEHGCRTSGYHFKDGKLIIFRPETVMVIRGWNEPSAVQKFAGGWEAFAPAFRLVNPYRSIRPKKAFTPASTPVPDGQLTLGFERPEFVVQANKRRPVTSRQALARQKKRAFNAFRFSLPREVARVLERFLSHQWPLLVLLAHDPGSLDLARANSALAYAVAQHVHGRMELIRSEQLGKRRQRDLLEMLGVPPTQAIVNLFRKMEPESVDGRTWRPLLRALAEPGGALLKLLSHTPRINAGVMALVLDDWIAAAVTPSLIAEVAGDAREKYRADTAGMIAQLRAMHEELEDGAGLKPIASREKLQTLYDQTAGEFQKLQESKQLQGIFPPPPLPGVDGKIIALRTETQLLREGREQHNCVGSYGWSVVRGECYIYRLLMPERATISITRGADGEWGLGEIKGPCNVAVKPTTRRYVEDWLDQYWIGNR